MKGRTTMKKWLETQAGMHLPDRVGGEDKRALKGWNLKLMRMADADDEISDIEQEIEALEDQLDDIRRYDDDDAGEIDDLEERIEHALATIVQLQDDPLQARRQLYVREASIEGAGAERARRAEEQRVKRYKQRARKIAEYHRIKDQPK